MPFYSVPKLDIGILSQVKETAFKVSKSSVVSFRPDGVGSADAQPKVTAVQRLKTGDDLNPDVWHFEPDRDVSKCLPGIRTFRLVFEGKEYGQRLKKKDRYAADLYRSIIGRDRVRFTVLIGSDERATLDVDLDYHLEKPAEPAPNSSTDDDC